MRWEVVAWAAVALLLFAAETLAPGAFMLWMGFAAAAVFLGVLLVPLFYVLIRKVSPFRPTEAAPPPAAAVPPPPVQHLA